MVITDPIADMLTRIRNAIVARQDKVAVPVSKMKDSIAAILLEEGYIRGIDRKADKNGDLMVLTLKYGPDKTNVIRGLKRISTPGLRVYAGSKELPRVLNGLGIALISTSKGVMTDKKARELGVGGEVLAYIW